MTRSLKFQTLVTMVTMLLFAFVIGFGLCFAFSTKYSISLKTRDMEEMYETLSSVFGGSSSILPRNIYIGNDSEEDTYENLSRICDEDSISLLVMSSSGDIEFAYGYADILEDRLNSLTFGANQNSKILKQTDNYTIQSDFNNKYEVKYLEMWGFLDNGSMFIARTSAAGIQQNIRAMLSLFAFVCIVVLIAFLFIMYFVSSSLTTPVKDLVDISNRINENDFDSASDDSRKKSKFHQRDELGMLENNLTVMAHKMEKNIADLKSTNLRLENELKNKAELEEQRKKYISDISHELKTPIALIAGYAEGLKEGISTSREDQDYYLDVIIDEADKMSLMLKRLSSLNKLESGVNDINMEHLNIIDVINGYLNTMAIILEEKGASIFFDNTQVTYVWTDEFLFEEVLMNYLNNALNHMDDRKVIRITVVQTEDKARLTVFNTGSQIPEEELDRIWEKFYKVDKARTRAYGGSGLGLSIVKAVSLALNQECGVYNTEDGVAFWFDMDCDDGNVKKAQSNPEPDPLSREGN